MSSWSRVGIGCLGLIVNMIVGTLMFAWALMKLWAWFIVPSFEVRPLDRLSAIGLGLIAGLLTFKYTASRKEDDWVTAAWTGVGVSIVVALSYVGVGWFWLQVAR